MIELTEKDYLYIKDTAHRMFIHTPVSTKAYGIATERYFVAMCYTTAVIGFLQSKGLINEACQTNCTENKQTETEG